MAIEIGIVTSESTITSSTGKTVGIEVVRTTDAPIPTTTGIAVLEVIGRNLVQNAVVSTTPPISPYEGQIWIDIS